ITLTDEGEFVLDEQGDLVLDEEAVTRFVDELADRYDTVGATRQFRATNGETIAVSGGTYGNKLDQKAEVAYLLKAFGERRSEIHTPEYTHMALLQGKDDIGDTYIEIDMTAQQMYYYSAGECVLSTPVVTGNTALRRGTPVGVNFVYSKERNRILRGEDYASPVDYWMPVNGGIGIHDASWRSEYGGEIYKTDGSHGCINTPRDKVEQLFEMVELGTPCVMYY
ncbi:MAG: L,D-transpeptidase family protein, partial [Lachnospiraceae bacterium]|nr:L,D-transpeptidase family protein [Lachnospiraceae bacterium]